MSAQIRGLSAPSAGKFRYLKIYASAISVFTQMHFGATFFTTETKIISNATRFSIGKTAITG